MTAWVTLADIGTAAGTLILAGATLVAVRAAARSTRIAERALLAGQRPVLAPGRPDDGAESVQFADGRVFSLGSRHALLQQEGGVIYLAIPLCNVGAGLAMLRGYRLQGEPAGDIAQDPRGVARHLRGDPLPQPQTFSVQQRGQPSVTRFVLLPDAGSWRCDATRYWSLPASKDLRRFGFT